MILLDDDIAVSVNAHDSTGVIDLAASAQHAAVLDVHLGNALTRQMSDLGRFRRYDSGAIHDPRAIPCDARPSSER